MEYFLPIAEYERNGFNVVVDIADEFLDLADVYSGTYLDYHIAQLAIDDTIEWFMLRVRVSIDDIELASAFRGTMFCNPLDTLTNGVVEDLIASAIGSARERIPELMAKLSLIELS